MKSMIASMDPKQRTNRILTFLIRGIYDYGVIEVGQGQAPNVSSMKDFLDILWKVAAGISLTFYLVGFIVVNFHASRFGYYSVSLVSAQYLAAGVWAFVPTVVGWFLVT